MLTSALGGLRRAMSTAAKERVTGRHLIAVCQLTSGNDIDKNFETAKGMIERARQHNCEMVFFPECFDYIGLTREETVNLAMPADGEYVGRFRELAKSHGLWLSLGGLHHKDSNDKAKPWNSHLVIDAEGRTVADYRKLHLFDLDIPGKVRLMESEFSKAGNKLIPPVNTPVGKLGLSICYDLRFAELALWNRSKGAQILSYPSAFTLTTGLAHWETLLRTRAIETQCYVIAAAQTGKHNDKRMSYGHSMVVDPWGAVIAQCSETVDMCLAELNLNYVDEVRLTQPVFAHRRNDLYGVQTQERLNPDERDEKFGQHTIDVSTIFYRSALSFAFVNIKPVLPGHVLVCPLRGVTHLTELTDLETADLFNVAKRVQRMIEHVYGTKSSTLAVQDGPDAGQTIEHVHVHILPRKPTDFGGSTDTVYKELSRHDKKEEHPQRTKEQMTEEASKYRAIFDELFDDGPNLK